MPEPPSRFDPVSVHTGHEGIRAALAKLQAFPLTEHAVLGSVFDGGVEQDTASGRIACVAHHLTERAEGELGDIVWHLHYADQYRVVAGSWYFTRREVHLDWIETRKPRAWRIGPETR